MVKVSVIIPMYNVEAYIGECVESVCNQTLKELEIICIDDGSADGTAQVVEKLQRNDSRIKMILQENKGVSASRNAGLDAASGEYISFLDSDDYLKEETLAVLYQMAKKENLDELFYSAESFFDTENLKEKQKVYDHYYERKGVYDHVYTGQEMFVAMHENKEFKPSVCLQLWKRAFIEKSGVRFCEGIVHEDNLFTIECMAVSQRVMLLNEPFYMRRLRDNSIMTKEKAFRNAYGYFRVMCEMMDYAEQYQLDKNPKYWAVYLKRLKMLSDMGAKCIRESKIEIESVLKNLTVKEQQMFTLLILNGAEVRDRLGADCEKRIRAEKEQANRATQEIERLREQAEELQAIRKSSTYRIGRLITWLPRKIKDLLKEK